MISGMKSTMWSNKIIGTLQNEFNDLNLLQTNKIKSTIQVRGVNQIIMDQIFMDWIHLYSNIPRENDREDLSRFIISMESYASPKASREPKDLETFESLSSSWTIWWCTSFI